MMEERVTEEQESYSVSVVEFISLKIGRNPQMV